MAWSSLSFHFWKRTVNFPYFVRISRTVAYLERSPENGFTNWQSDIVWTIGLVEFSHNELFPDHKCSNYAEFIVYYSLRHFSVAISCRLTLVPCVAFFVSSMYLCCFCIYLMSWFFDGEKPVVTDDTLRWIAAVYHNRGESRPVLPEKEISTSSYISPNSRDNLITGFSKFRQSAE